MNLLFRLDWFGVRMLPHDLSVIVAGMLFRLTLLLYERLLIIFVILASDI